jgi:outer membrane protein assembly factor BamB
MLIRRPKEVRVRVRLRSSLALAGIAGLIAALAAPAAGTVAHPGATFGDWPTYHMNATHTGYDPTTPAIGTLSKAWSVTLDGAVYAEPLMVGGRLFVATENDSIYALNPQTGATLWMTNVGTPVPLSQLPCGDIDPLGITGTPVFDPVSGRLFAAAELLKGQNTVEHDLFAFDPATGAVLGSRVIDAKGSDPIVEQQRPALAVGGGRVYVAYGALSGDCGGFHGYVVASPTSLTGSKDVYVATKYEPGAQEGGIWATPGPSIDADGNVFVAVGNGRTTDPFDYSDSVLKLTKSLKLRTYFAPTTWKQDNIVDADLGSQGPALVGSYIYADGKSGTAYLIKQGHMGHIGGQIASASVCRSFGGTAVVGMTVYVPCTDGIRAVDVTGGVIKVLWHTTSTAAIGPPVVGGGAVWSLGVNNGTLYALNPSNGAMITSIPVGAVEHFATPMLSGGYAFVGTATGVFAVKGA